MLTGAPTNVFGTYDEDHRKFAWDLSLTGGTAFQSTVATVNAHSQATYGGDFSQPSKSAAAQGTFTLTLDSNTGFITYNASSNGVNSDGPLVTVAQANRTFGDETTTQKAVEIEIDLEAAMYGSSTISAGIGILSIPLTESYGHAVFHTQVITFVAQKGN